MLGVLQGFAVILGAILAGYIAVRTRVITSEQRRVLNDMSFYIASPALLFTVLLQADLAVVLSPVMLAAVLAALIAAGTFVLASRLWFKRDLASTALGASASGHVNANNLGLPVAVYILGDAAYIAPLILVQVLFFTPAVLAVLETTRHPGRETKAQGGYFRIVLTAIGRATRNPMVVATALGFLCALFEVPVHDIVLAPLDLIGAAAIPMILMAFGASLSGQRALLPGSDRTPVIVATGIKLFLMPAVAWGLSLAFGLSAHETFAATTIAALPTAQNVFNFAEAYRRAEIQVRDTVLITTFASLPLIALIAWLLSA